MKKISRILKLSAAMLMMTVAGAAAQDLYLGGYARNTTSLLLNDSLDIAQVQSTFDLTAEYSGDMTALSAEGYVSASGMNELEAGVKELYLNLYFDYVDITIGKQQIIWGEGDGVFITDVISPKDLSDFVLPDFDEIRMGVTALRADWYLGPIDLEVVWVPMFIPAVMPSGMWSVPAPLPDGAVINEARMPAAGVENSEAFAKMSYVGSSIDISLMGGYMWDDLPIPHMVAPFTFTPVYHRILMGGGSFSTDIAGLVVKGEGAYYSGKHFNTGDMLEPELVIEKGFVHYMAGLDYSFSGLKLGTQFIQEIIIGHDSAMINNNAFKSTMTFVAARSFLNDTLLLEFFTYVGLTNEDALLRPKITYDVADGFEVSIGSDIFLGESGDFGRYDDNDIVYAKMKYSF